MPLFDWVMTYGNKNFNPAAGSWVCPSNGSELFDGVGDWAMDVTKFGLVGDGVTLNDNALYNLIRSDIPFTPTFGVPLPLYFPPGDYLFRNPILWPDEQPSGYSGDWLEAGPAGACCMSFRGAGVDKTILRLADNSPSFQNASNPTSFVLTKRGNRSFRQFARDLTIDIGNGNPGAIGIDYHANNRGSLRDVRIIARGPAFAGISMRRTWPGPALIKRVAIDGFDYGIIVSQSEYGMVLEHVTVRNQRLAGIRHTSNMLSIRGLTSVQQDSSIPALNLNGNGFITLLDSSLKATSAAASPGLAITASNHNVYLRNVNQQVFSWNGTNYAQASSEIYSYPTADAKNAPVNLHGGGDGRLSLGLKIAETPLPYWSNDPNDWIGVGYGSNWCMGTTTKAFKRALDWGRPCIYIPAGLNRIGPDNNFVYVIPRHVRLITGADAHLNDFSPAVATVTLYVAGDASDPPLVFDSLTFRSSWKFVHNSTRTVVFISCRMPSYYSRPNSGNLFLEDVEPGSGRLSDDPAGVGALWLFEYPQNVWGRQLNPETIGSSGPRFKIINRGANLWILGIKTEGVGTIIRTENGARTELLGNLIYTVSDQTDPNQAAFEVFDATATHFYSYRSYESTSRFPFQIRARQSGVTLQKADTELSWNIMASSFSSNWQTGPTGLCSPSCDWTGGITPPSGTCQYDFVRAELPANQPGLGYGTTYSPNMVFPPTGSSPTPSGASSPSSRSSPSARTNLSTGLDAPGLLITLILILNSVFLAM